MSSAKQLYQWIEEGEHAQQDFKETISSSRKIAKTICSFANTRGGRILVGVRDNRAIRGIKAEEEQHMLEAAASFFCKKEVPLRFEVVQMGLKQVLVAHVPESEHKPVFTLGDDEQWWAYIRVKDKCLLASKIVLDVIRREQKGENNLIELGSKEEGLLKYLDQNERITLKAFCKLMNIAPWRARKILVKLITAGVVRVHTTEKQEFYTLS